LFERVQVEKKDDENVAREFKDYKISINETDFPSGVTMERLVG
jgi:hypothetical protein